MQVFKDWLGGQADAEWIAGGSTQRRFTPPRSRSLQSAQRERPLNHSRSAQKSEECEQTFVRTQTKVSSGAGKRCSPWSVPAFQYALTECCRGASDDRRYA